MTLATGAVLTRIVDLTDGNMIIATPGATQTVRVLGTSLRALATAATLQFHSGAIDHVPLALVNIGGDYLLPIDGIGWFDGVVGQPLQLTVTGRIAGIVRYQIIA